MDDCMLKLRALMTSIFLGFGTVISSTASETVQFEGARFRSEMTATDAISNGIPVLPPAPTEVQGYVVKPQGQGPFPAVIVLHGCAGMGTLFNPRLERNFWPDLLTSWGYAVLLVDSFVRRNVKDTCDYDASYYRVQDAYGALHFFSQQPYVDKNRIALLGFSAGGIATLVGLRPAMPRIFDMAPLEFKGGIAFYPCFGSSLNSTKPILILNGGADDWSKEPVCRAMMNLRPTTSASIQLIIYPNAFHDFDRPPMYPGRMAFGHWLEYNAEAAKLAAEEVRAFLLRNLNSRP
jgi:dienelactone hydrolase